MLKNNPDQCGSVGWTSFHKAKSRWFHSQLGHMPGLQVQALVGVHGVVLYGDITWFSGRVRMLGFFDQPVWECDSECRV